MRRDDEFATAAVRYGMTVCDKSCTCKVPEDKSCGEEDRGVGGGDGAGHGAGDGADGVNGTGGLRLNDGAGGGTGATGAGAAVPQGRSWTETARHVVLRIFNPRFCWYCHQYRRDMMSGSSRLPCTALFVGLFYQTFWCSGFQSFHCK